MAATTCLRCGKAGYRTEERARSQFANTPLQVEIVVVDLCQVCRTAARHENDAAQARSQGKDAPGFTQ